VLRQTKLPGLKLGLYQVIVPDGKGRPSDAFERRMEGYCEAGRQGMYDHLDVICPVLYQRFGARDATPETLRRWIAAATTCRGLGRPVHLDTSEHDYAGGQDINYSGWESPKGHRLSLLGR
jgi:hypothetical protein